MKRSRIVRFFGWISALAALGCNESALHRASPQDAAPALDEREACLSIVSWNDLHGQVVSDVALLDTGRVPAGGVIALADAVADVRKTGDDVVVLDAGDLFTGPLESTLAEGAPVIEAYRAIGVDAAAIGNHEFDFGPVGYDRVTAKPGLGDDAGPDGPRGALLARIASAPFPFVSANLHRADGSPLTWKNYAPSTTIRRGAFEVGVVGYTTIETPTTTLKPNVEGLDFANGAAKSVAAEVRRLRALGASPVVLLAHASIEGDLPQSLDDAGDDPQGAQRKGEIATLLAAMGDDLPDLVIGGHRHAWALGRVRGVPFVTSDQHGVGLARTRFCKPDEGAHAKLVSVERRASIPSSPPRSALGVEVAAAVAPFIDSVRAEADQVIAEVPRFCANQSLDGNAYGEQMARAVEVHAADAAPPPAGVPIVAVVNSGGFRAPIPKGPLRFRDLFAAMPFENQVGVCATTRAGVIRALKNAMNRAAARERFPFGIAGAHVFAKRAEDGALTLDKLDIAGATKDDDPVWFALSDFLLWGGDGFLDGVTCTSIATSSTRLRDAWRELLEKEQGGCDGPAKNVTVAK